jgi:hypothetical protein
MYEQYEKNNKKVWVRADLKGKQKEFCMCWDCQHFKPDTADKGCKIIKTVLDLATEKTIVLPVWECVSFAQK